MSEFKPGTTEILITKLTPPRVQTPLVSRARLLAQLDNGLARKLTLIAAPPGFGKTTLIGAWLVTRDEPSAWVSLDAGDDDPLRFWRYVISACGGFEDGLGRSALIALRAAQPPAFESALTPMINALAQLPRRCILVLDDYHVITSPWVHETIAFLLENLPASLHLVLLTRSEPPLPLARLRARNELSELNANDLRFSLDEIQLFFQQTLRLPLSTEALARLEARTEGWAAALRLVAFALEGQKDERAAEHFVATFSGEHRHILEYLAGEILSNQSEALQIFLLQSSVLHRLCGSLCDALTQRNDSAALLEQLARANLFLIPLGREADQVWYRYHALFAEALLHFARQRLGEEGLRALYDQAALWHASHGFLLEAIDASIAAQSFSRAATWIERLLDERSFYELHTLRRWANSMPQHVLADHPLLCFNHAMAVLFTSDRYAPATESAVEEILQMAEAVWRERQDAHGLGQVYALRSTIAMWQGDAARSVACASEALELLPEEDVNWRGVSLLTACAQELNAGKLDAAQRMLLEARVLCEAAQNIHGALAATLVLAQIALAHLELDQAQQLYLQVLNEVGEAETTLDDRGSALIGLGRIAYERNDLNAAERYITQTLEVLQRRADERVQLDVSLLQTRMQRARGQMAQAQQTLHALAARTHKPSTLREVLAWQTRLALDAGDMSAAQNWYATHAQHTHDVAHVQQEQEALISARMHLDKGRPETALQLLQRWQTDAHRQGRTQSELEILCLQALAFSAQSRVEKAHTTLVRALAIAQPKDCRRVFLDEGKSMALLLQAAAPELKKRPLATFATLLLKAFAATTLTSPASSPLLEPLSAQEQRVLQLLAAGMSNPQIARELVVSVNTVKTQVQSIYRKLNVNNREEAREVARQLNLL